MFKRTLIAIVALLVLVAGQPLRGSTDVNWVGGEGFGKWSNPDNWSPPVVPDGDYVVTIDADGNDLTVWIEKFYREVKELNCYGNEEYGEFVLDAEYPYGGAILCEPNGLHNYSDNLKISVEVGGDVTNHSGCVLRLENTQLWDDLYNYGTVDVAGELKEVHNIINEGSFSLQASAELWTKYFNNNGNLLLDLRSELWGENHITNCESIELEPDSILSCKGTIDINEPNGLVKFTGATVAANSISLNGDTTLTGFGQVVGNVNLTADANFVITGTTNIVGDVNISPNATLQVSDGATLVTGQTVCNGTIHIKGGYLIPQGGLSGDCNIIWEAGLFTNPADFNLDGEVNFGDFAYFAETWLWQTSWY